MIDYIVFLQDMRDKPYKQWCEQLTNNAFEIKNKVNKQGNYIILCPKSGKLREFHINLIWNKLNNYKNTLNWNELFVS